MPITVSKLHKKLKATSKEKWIPIEHRSGCYAVVAALPRNSKRFVGKVGIAGKTYKVALGRCDKTITSLDIKKILKRWFEIKDWAKEKQCDPKKFSEKNTLVKSSKSLKEVFDLFLVLDHANLMVSFSDQNLM